MPKIVEPAEVEPVVAGLLGAIDVDGGPTDEQLAVLGAVTAHLWERPDLDLARIAPFDAATTASALRRDPTRRRFCEMLVTLEMCRHPQSAAQVAAVETWSDALGVGGPHLAVMRTAVDEGAVRATEDFDRFYARDLEQLSEPALRDRYLRLDTPDPALAQRLQALHDLPPDTLGYAYIEFYRRNDITVPGADTHTPAHYVSHDMNHVIADYEPTGPGEIALGAFTLAMNDNDANWLQFVLNLVIHEAGILRHGAIAPKDQTLTRPGATELVGEAFARGAGCSGDFSQADHLAMADWTLEAVRAHYDVAPRTVPMV